MGRIPGSRTIADLKLKLQIMCGQEVAMGPGKADLLAAIEAEGSISAAGRAMGMSYRRAWSLVDTMNRCFAEPLVEAVPGGGKGAGARLTPAGEAALAAFRELETRAANCASGPALDVLNGALRDEPV